jgi:hypothetical protein
VAEGIADLAVTVAPELILQRHLHFGACFHGRLNTTSPSPVYRNRELEVFGVEPCARWSFRETHH